LRRRRPTLGAQRLGRPILIGTEAFGRRSACAPNEFGLGRPSARGRPACRMNSAWGGLRPTVGLRRPENCLLRRRRPTLGVQRRLACSALEGRFQSARRPSAGGRPARRMNSASRGLRPTVGLRRPENCLLRRRRPTLGVQRLGRPILIGTKAFGRWSACAPNEFGLGGPSADGRPAPTEERRLRRRRPTLGVQRLEGPISIGTKAFGRWSACAPNECGLRRPSADGRPTPTEERRLRRWRPTLGAQRLEGPISIGTKAFGPRSACAPNEFGLGRPSADGRPAPTEERRLRRRRPTLGVQRLGRPISIGTKAFGRWSACMPNEFGLGGPSANGRPAPTEERRLRRRRPTLGAQRLGRPISIGTKAFGRRSACADRGTSLASAKADAWRAAPGGTDFNRRGEDGSGPRWTVGGRRTGWDSGRNSFRPTT